MHFAPNKCNIRLAQEFQIHPSNASHKNGLTGQGKYRKLSIIGK